MLIRFVWLFFVFIVAGCATKYNYLPVTSGELVEHSCFSLSYLEEHEQAEWVFYRLTPDMISGKVKRNDNFRVDVKVTSGSATLADYKGSGYDRGHLCPAGSMKLNKKAMSESFLMSNMSPQMPAFNRGMWRMLEESVREWGMEEKELYVVTGPVFKDNIDTIGVNCVTVPGYFYKIVFAPNSEKMIGFLLPNRKVEGEFWDYSLSVDDVEKFTGIDFFCGLRDRDEEELESVLDVEYWK